MKHVINSFTWFLKYALFWLHFFHIQLWLYFDFNFLLNNAMFAFFIFFFFLFSGVIWQFLPFIHIMGWKRLCSLRYSRGPVHKRLILIGWRSLTWLGSLDPWLGGGVLRERFLFKNWLLRWRDVGCVILFQTLVKSDLKRWIDWNFKFWKDQFRELGVCQDYSDCDVVESLFFDKVKDVFVTFHAVSLEIRASFT